MNNDILRNIGIAGVAAVPFVGGPISFLLDKYVPEESRRRQSQFLLQLSDDIELLKDKINYKNMDSPEFKAMLMKMLSASIYEHRKEKLISYRNILLNVLLDENMLHFDKSEFFASLVTDLVPDEIKILNIFYQLDVKKVKIPQNFESRRDIYAIIKGLFHETNDEYVRALVNDCMRYNLVSGSPKQKEKYGREGIFITELGEEFVEYIFSPREVDFFC